MSSASYSRKDTTSVDGGPYQGPLRSPASRRWYAECRRPAAVRRARGPRVRAGLSGPGPRAGPSRRPPARRGLESPRSVCREGIPTLKLALPHILGADGAGHIASVGSDVTDLEVGDRVVLNPGISCGRCEYCLKGEDSGCVDYRILGEHLPGTYAEQVAVPARNALKIPTDISFEAAAAAPLAFMTAWRI